MNKNIFIIYMYNKLCLFFPSLAIDEVYKRAILLTEYINPQNSRMFLGNEN